MRSGLSHAPNSALLQDLLGRILLEAGAIDEAIVRLEIALRLDPTVSLSRVELSRAHALLGDWPRAYANLEPLDPSAGFGDAARARYTTWGGTAGPTGTARANTYQWIGDALTATRSLTDDHRAFMVRRVAEARGRLRALFHQRNAEIYAFVGELDEAMESVRRAVDADLIDFGWIERCPALAPLRTNLEMAARWAPVRAAVAARAGNILESLRASGSASSR